RARRSAILAAGEALPDEGVDVRAALARQPQLRVVDVDRQQRARAFGIPADGEQIAAASRDDAAERVGAGALQAVAMRVEHPDGGVRSEVRRGRAERQFDLEVAIENR